MEIDFEKLVGKRILVDTYDGYIEYGVLEISPEAKFVKLKNALNGNQCWQEISNVNVIEILKTVKLK
jgi:hypothetical protein